MTMTGQAFDAIAIGSDIQRRVGVKTSRDEPLARFTTMRVGGPADLFAVAHNAFELRGLIKFARSRGLPHLVLGRGSNAVISDRGVRGLLIQDRAEGVEIRDNRLLAEAGLPMARAATVTQGAGLSGLEFGLAIPGTVGGAVWANAGAHESDIAQVLESATVLLSDGSERTLPLDELRLGYRDSRFKGDPQEIVLSGTFRLEPASADQIKLRLDDIRRWRQAHQPLGLPSAGSVFRNPEGRSAGALIDEAGLKGFSVGGATVSEKHANFIVNDRRGSAADVRRLGERVQAEVARRSRVELEFEIVFLGDWAGWVIGEGFA
ncbi:MAG TPA: UDP-N-acetylmuramate dehydrogenase [Candidatus Limnocylindrales bacterium]